jgi:hypothetical protein
MACWLVTEISVLSRSDQVGLWFSRGGGRTRCGQYHLANSESTVVDRPLDSLSATVCATDCGQTRRLKNNQKTAVTNVHVFMMLTPMFSCPYRRALGNFLSGSAPCRRGLQKRPAEGCRGELVYQYIQSAFFGRGISDVSRLLRAEAVLILTGLIAPGAVFFRRHRFSSRCGAGLRKERSYLLRSNNATANCRRTSALRPNGSRRATASRARLRSNSLARSMPTTAG